MRGSCPSTSACTLMHASCGRKKASSIRLAMQAQRLGHAYLLSPATLAAAKHRNESKGPAMTGRRAEVSWYIARCDICERLHSDHGCLEGFDKKADIESSVAWRKKPIRLVCQPVPHSRSRTPPTSSPETGVGLPIDALLTPNNSAAKVHDATPTATSHSSTPHST